MKYKISLLILGLLAIKLIFQPNEFTGDSYGYACEIIKGDWISGHHLLHKYFVGSVWKIAQFLGIFADPLQVGVWLNAVFGSLSLLLLNNILSLKNLTTHSRFYWILFVASCFVFTRYSSENETYIFPIFFTLLGWFQQIRDKKWYSLIFYLLAVGFHQTYILICIPLIWNPSSIYHHNFSGIKPPSLNILSKKEIHFTGVVRAIVFTSCVFGGYLFAAHSYNRSFESLFFQDVQSGLIQTIPDLKNLLFGLINSVRIFVQIHGELKYQLYHTWPIWFGLIACLGYLITFPFQSKFYSKNESQNEFNSSKKSEFSPVSTVQLGPLLSLIATWLFALYSVGNLEFMVFIPFLIVLAAIEFPQLKNTIPITQKSFRLIPSLFQKVQSLFTIQRLSILLFIWNFSVYTLPHSIYATQNLDGLMSKIQILEAPQIQPHSPKVITNNTRNQSIYFITPLAALFENYGEYLYWTDQDSTVHLKTPYQRRFFHTSLELQTYLGQNNHPPKQSVQIIEISDNRETERSNLDQLFKNTTVKVSPEKNRKNSDTWVEYTFSEIRNLEIQ